MEGKKRLPSFVIAFILCLSVLPSTTFAVGDFIIQNGVLTEYVGSGGNVIIPNSVDTIGDEAFSHCSSLISVTIPGSVTEIGFEAFYDCTGLAKVTLSEGVSTIGHSAFAMCTSLASITIPDSVTEIDQYAFWACSSLTNVTGGNGLVSIGYKAFADCDSLTNIAIPSGVTISPGAFSNVPINEVSGTPTGAGLIAKLPSPPPKVIIPEDVSQVEYWSQHNDENWSLPQSKESIFQRINNLVKQLTAGKNSETEKAKAIYNWVSNNISYDWEAYNGGESTTKSDAFYVYYFQTGVCSEYVKLTHFMFTMAGLPATSIFSDSLNHAWNGVYVDGKWILLDTTWDEWDISLDSRQDISQIIFQNGIFLGIIRGDGSIDYQMWDLNKYPSEIIVPSGTIEITFNDMDELTSVTLPDGLTEISTCAFESCTNLTHVTVPDSVTKIGNRAFAYCSGLTNIPISNNVTEIGREAFSNCTGLTNVTLPSSLSQIGDVAFSRCSNLTSVTIPASVTKIGMSAFFSCTNLQRVVIANGDTEIGELAFSEYRHFGGYLPMQGLTVYSPAGGKVENYCKENGITFVATPANFTDIPDTPASTWFAEAMKWAVERGIVTDIDTTTFATDVPCTRAQIVTFLWRAVGSPDHQSSKNLFVDVTYDAYYYDAVLWAVEQGITAGTSASTFNPDATVTRGQAVTFLYRATGSPVINDNCPFRDVAVNAYYSDAVRWAVNKGVTAGTSSTTFSPDATCTRGQIVTFLYRDMA